MFVFAERQALTESGDDEPESCQLVFSRLPRRCLHRLYGATSWGTDAIALITESGPSTTNSRLMDLQLCARCSLVPDIENRGDRKSIGLRAS